MPRLRYTLPGLFLVIVPLLWWGLPAALRAVPSRYVARLPEPVQQLAAPRDQVPLLPTVAPPDEARALLPAGRAATYPAPATPTPPPPATSRPQRAAAPAGETATTTPAATLAPRPEAVRLEGFRHQFQTWNNCGPATIAMALSYYDLDLDQKETAAVLKPNPEDRNVSPQEMAAYVDEQTPYAALFRANGALETVRQLLAGGFPVIIEVGIEPPGEYRWLGWYGHYLLLVAYDDARRQFWAYDSWFGTSEVPMENATREGRVLAYDDADRQWRQFNRNYVVLYRPQEQPQVAEIIGGDMEDTAMWQQALIQAQKELKQEPQNAFLWFNLGTALNALGRYGEASTAFDQARAIGLPWRMLWYQFGPYEAYYQVGRYDDVILLANTTLKDRPYFEESYYYKGLALAALGDDEGARENWRRAVDFNPNFAPAATALNQRS